MERPDSVPGGAALRGIMDDLDTALANVPDTQRRLMSISGVAWSDDGLVKAEVGPRGQLVGLEIDPRVFRRPDARALEASILSAAAAAVRHVTDEAQQIILGRQPPELAELRARFAPDETDPVMQLMRTDAEIMIERRRPDG